MMKAVAIVDEKRAEVVERPVPELKPNEVLLRIERCMLCTWEQRVFLRLQPYQLPYIGGHEFAGTIAAVGSDLDPARYPPRDPVLRRMPVLPPRCGEYVRDAGSGKQFWWTCRISRGAGESAVHGGG